MSLNFNIATSWNELNEFQRRKISNLIFNSKSGEKGIYFAVIYYLFCPNPWHSWKGFNQIRKFYKLIKIVPMSEYLPFSKFIFEKLSLTKFPKFVKIDGIKYYGPADRLSNITIEELNFAYRFYYEWMAEKDPSALDRLITTIYRPQRKKKRGDIREPFDQTTIMARGTIFPKLPEETKISIGLAFKGSIDHMFSKFPILFPPSKEKKSKEKPKYQSLVPMINAMFMYENQPFGPREATIKTNAYVFFDVSQETIIAARKREAELKKNKR